MTITLNEKETAVYKKVKNGLSVGEWTVIADYLNLNDNEIGITIQLKELGIVNSVYCDSGEFLGWEINKKFPHKIVTDSL